MERKDVKMAKLKIIRSPEWYKWHIVNTEHIEKYGIEKACILANIDKADEFNFDEKYKLFPYVKKELFYKYLEELLNEGVLEHQEKEIQ